jgi:hypothetical protein
MGQEIGVEGLEGLGIPARRAEQHAPPGRVVEQADEANGTPHVLLIDPDARHLGMGFLSPRRLHMDVQRLPDPPRRHPEQLGDLGNRQLFRQGQHQGIHQQREAAPQPRPRHRHLGRLLATIAAHPRHIRMQIGFVLEEMQVLPRAFKPVMDRLFRLPTTGTRQAFGSANQIEVDFPLFRLKPDVIHLPRRLQSKGNGKQGGRVHGVSFLHQVRREVNSSGFSTLFRTAPKTRHPDQDAGG